MGISHTAATGSNSLWRHNKDMNTISSRSQPLMAVGARCAATFSLASTNDFRRGLTFFFFFLLPVRAVHANERRTCQPAVRRCRLRSVLAARGRLPVAVPPRAHLYAVPALCLQLDIWYSEDRRHCGEERCKRIRRRGEADRVVGGVRKIGAPLQKVGKFTSTLFF